MALTTLGLLGPCAVALDQKYLYRPQVGDDPLSSCVIAGANRVVWLAGWKITAGNDKVWSMFTAWMKGAGKGLRFNSGWETPWQVGSVHFTRRRTGRVGTCPLNLSPPGSVVEPSMVYFESNQFGPVRTVWSMARCHLLCVT